MQHLLYVLLYAASMIGPIIPTLWKWIEGAALHSTRPWLGTQLKNYHVMLMSRGREELLILSPTSSTSIKRSRSRHLYSLHPRLNFSRASQAWGQNMSTTLHDMCMTWHGVNIWKPLFSDKAFDNHGAISP